MTVKTIYTTSEAAEYLGVGVQAVYLAKRLNKLKAFSKDARWYYHQKDLDEYKAFKYCKDKTEVNGTLVFDKSKGLYTPEQLSKKFGIDRNRIYHRLRTKQIKHTRSGSMYVININDFPEWMFPNEGRFMSDKTKNT